MATVAGSIKQWDLDFIEHYMPRAKEYGDVTPQGVAYHWELCGPDGATYVLFQELHHTPEDVKQAKAYINYSFDSLRITVLKCEKPE